MSIRWRRDSAILLKTLKKFFYPQTKILQRFSKNTYMSHGCVSSRLSYWKKGNYFCLDLHYVHNVETGQRHTQKRSKNLFYLQMKILQRFSKNTYMRRMIVDKVKNFSDFKLQNSLFEETTTWKSPFLFLEKK